MSNQKLKYLSQGVLSELKSKLQTNKDRYEKSGFNDKALDEGWNLELPVQVDLSPLAGLDGSPGVKQEISNSLLVWKALHNLTPALACDDRIWSRLSHVECFEYSRDRWLAGKKDEKFFGAVRKHFFAAGLNGYRDDHAISRLWWNAYIAKMIRPTDQKVALGLMIKTADIRSNIIERSRIVRRSCVTAALLRLMEKEGSVTATEDNFRKFMKVVKQQCGGVLFERLPDAEADTIMFNCFKDAKINV